MKPTNWSNDAPYFNLLKFHETSLLYCAILHFEETCLILQAGKLFKILIRLQSGYLLEVSTPNENVDLRS